MPLDLYTPLASAHYILLDSLRAWRRRVLTLLAVALARNLTAVLPPALCFCDIYWGGMTGCRAGGATGMATMSMEEMDSYRTRLARPRVRVCE